MTKRNPSLVPHYDLLTPLVSKGASTHGGGTDCGTDSSRSRQTRDHVETKILCCTVYLPRVYFTRYPVRDTSCWVSPVRTTVQVRHGGKGTYNTLIPRYLPNPPSVPFLKDPIKCLVEGVGVGLERRRRRRGPEGSSSGVIPTGSCPYLVGYRRRSCLPHRRRFGPNRPPSDPDPSRSRPPSLIPVLRTQRPEGTETE